MRLVQHPMGSLELAHWYGRPGRPPFHAPSRLACVGLFARLVDTGFTASLLLRGSVPGGTTAAASVKYEAVRERDPRFVYHGRVVRRDGWIALHYMYFYFMNDWRSTFAGANDHESDWEQILVFLEDAPEGPRPVINAGRSREAQLLDTLRAGRAELSRLKAGDFGDPRAHLHHAQHPVPPELVRQGRFVELWAATSISFVMVAVIMLTYTGAMRWWVALAVGIVAYTTIEAAFWRRLTTLLLRATLALAAVGALNPGVRVRRAAPRDRPGRSGGLDAGGQRARDPARLSPTS
ncbi:MAG: hypothetical protein ACHQZR_00040 [Candidatus Limnocylindrales bacterium]